MKKITLGLCFVFVTAALIAPVEQLCAQASDISFEKVKETCKGIAREDRLRITVTRFSVSSRAAQATGQFGEELTAIMTNAIQQTNCFRVLESTRNAADLDDEIRYNQSGRTDGEGPQWGQQLGAQAIVTAEVTEYNDGQSGVNLAGLSLGTTKAKLGIIVKVLDPQTRDLLWSKSVNGEAKKGGFTGVSAWGGQIKFAGASKVSEAMSSAVEDIVLRTVDILVKEREVIMKEFATQAQKEAAGTRTVINVSNTNFTKLNGLANTLKEYPQIKDLQKELNGAEGRIFLLHDGSSENIAELIDRVVGKQYEITGVQIGKITLLSK